MYVKRKCTPPEHRGCIALRVRHKSLHAPKHSPPLRFPVKKCIQDVPDHIHGVTDTPITRKRIDLTETHTYVSGEAGCGVGMGASITIIGWVPSKWPHV